MKMFTLPREKSWCLKLCEPSDERIYLRAADSTTGEDIATLLMFHPNGAIELGKGALAALTKLGYNPSEHDNTFNKDGTIIIH
jgi:hypothetical protein